MKKLILSFLVAFIAFSPAIAQKSISGIVKDAGNDETLPGVAIYLKNKRGVGTVTDLDGKYTMTIPADVSQPVIIFKYIGYITKEINVENKTVVNVNLEVNSEEIDEVIVTSFAIKRSRKALNYAVQDIKGDDLADSKEQNLVNALQGKIAGVQITATSGSPGASSQILIRGANSVNADSNNQPLFIVDGLPIDNSASFGGGNRAMDINPDDVESMVVLKGPAASALYGVEAANGAIIITTKSGKSGKTVIDFSANLGFSQALRTPDRQDKYMQGTSGYYDDQIISSWGPVFPSNTTKYDNVNNFLTEGITQKYNLSVSGGSEKSNFLISGNYTDITGILPGERYLRYGALLKGEIVVSSKLKVQGSSNLIFSENDRTPFGFMSSMYRWPSNMDMSVSENPDGSKKWLIPAAEGEEYTKNYLENPNWWVDYNLRGDNIFRNISQVGLSWDIFPGLNLTYRLGNDVTKLHYKSIVSPQSAGSKTSYEGYISESERFTQKANSTFLINYNTRITDKLNVAVLAGNNIQMEQARVTTILAEKYKNPDLNSINNMENFTPSQYTVQRRVVGVYGDLKIDYADMLFLSFTGRNDWSSTLPVAENSFFYPSVTAGLIASELFESNIFSYVKIRGNWAKVGKDAPAKRLYPVLEPSQVIGGGFKYDYYAGNPNLKPETTVSWETGFNMRLLNGLTTIDLTYYQMRSNDQIIQSRVSTASGWVMQVFNAGSIENKGVELFIKQKIISGQSFEWNINLNYSFNRSKLFELPSFVSRYPVTQGQVISALKPTSMLNSPLLAVSGTQYLRNKEGQLVTDEYGNPRVGTYILDENGDYVADTDGSYKVDQQQVYLGNREPDALIGITNKFSYRNLDFSFLLDFRKGGDVINATNAVMTSSGISEIVGEHRNEKILINGVVESPDGGFVPNENIITANQSFFYNYIGVGENFIEDASWMRLRNVSIGYRVPVGKINGVSGLKISLTGNNLLLFTKYSGGDPETNYGGSGVGGSGTTGLDYFNTPSVRSISLNIKASF